MSDPISSLGILILPVIYIKRNKIRFCFDELVVFLHFIPLWYVYVCTLAYIWFTSGTTRFCRGLETQHEDTR